MSSESFDPSKRRLCPDGACIGVIGDDGRCKACGRAASGAPVALVGNVAPSVDEDGDARKDHQEDHAEPREASSAQAEAGGAGAGFDPSRRLCDDGACVGVVGADGVCSVCGRRAES